MNEQRNRQFDLTCLSHVGREGGGVKITTAEGTTLVPDFRAGYQLGNGEARCLRRRVEQDVRHDPAILLFSLVHHIREAAVSISGPSGRAVSFERSRSWRCGGGYSNGGSCRKRPRPD